MVERNQDIKQLVPIQLVYDIIERMRKMTEVCAQGWKEDADNVAKSIPIIPDDQVAINNRLADADRMESVLRSLQDCYPHFCEWHDAGNWIKWGLGQAKHPVYPKEHAVEMLSEANVKLALENETQKRQLAVKQKENEDLVSQLCDFDAKFEDIRSTLGCVAGHEVGAVLALRETLKVEECATNQLKAVVYDLKKKLDAVTVALLEVKSINGNTPGE